MLAPRCGSSTLHEETVMGTHRPHPILMPGRVSIPGFQCQFCLPPLYCRTELCVRYAKPTTFGERIHSDLCGPFPVSATGGFEYILSFVDSATGYSEIYFMQGKLSSEVKKYFYEFVKKHSASLPDGEIVEWFTDNAAALGCLQGRRACAAR